jgi:predicted nuclease with TOPRIM domain
MSKADNIIQQQKELQKELEALQSKCEHNKQIIKQLPDKNEWWWQCNECTKNTRYVNQQEIFDYLSK